MKIKEMTQLQEITDLPEFIVRWEHVNDGSFISRIVDFTQKHGPVFRFRLDDPAQDLSGLYMVGPEANRFVFHTGRQHFSHDRGWTPILGAMVGRGLINMDDPDHAIHRKMWNPAFTNDVMLAYIPLIHQIIEQKIAKFATKPFVNTQKESQEITFDVAAAALAGIEQGANLGPFTRVVLAHVTR